MPSKMTSFSHTHTDKDLKRLRQFLTETLKKSGLQIPRQPADGMQLLNLACGRADETEVLADVFGSESDSIHLTGIDIRTREIGEARERWKKLPSKASADFLVQDASQLDHLNQLGSEFDIAFI